MNDVEYIDFDLLENLFRRMKLQLKSLENSSKEIKLLDLLVTLNGFLKSDM